MRKELQYQDTFDPDSQQGRQRNPDSQPSNKEQVFPQRSWYS
jgi:hypothetical protein